MPNKKEMITVSPVEPERGSDELQIQVESVYRAVVFPADIKVVTNADYAHYAEMLAEEVIPRRKQIGEIFKEAKAKAHAAHKAIVKAEKTASKTVTQWEETIRHALATFDGEERVRLRRAQEEDSQRLRDAMIREVLDEANLLVEAGETDEAKGVLESAVSADIDVSAPYVAATAAVENKHVSFRVDREWKVLDVRDIKAGFWHRIVDREKIDRMVEVHGVKAEVYVGGIEVTETSVTRMKPRKKG